MEYRPLSSVRLDKPQHLMYGNLPVLDVSAPDYLINLNI